MNCYIVVGLILLILSICYINNKKYKRSIVDVAIVHPAAISPTI